LGLEKLLRQIEAKRREKVERNLLTRLHYNMCQAANGWIPYEEFLNLPIPYIFAFLNCHAEAMSELEKQQMKR